MHGRQVLNMTEELQKYKDILERERRRVQRTAGEGSKYLWILF